MTLTDRPPTTNESTEVVPVSRSRPKSQFVAGGILLMVGGLWLLERLDWIDLTLTAVLALATVAMGVSLMVLARDGAHPGLIIMGTIIGLLALASAAAPFEGFQGEVGDRTVVVSSVDDIEANYNLAMGTLTIDLTQIDNISALDRLNASVGTGELKIVVPEDVDIRVDARMGAGQIVLFDQTFDGIGLSRSYQTPGFGIGANSIDLDLEVFAGRLEVSHD